MNTPTILIPGVRGTTLANTNTLDFDIIYSGIQSYYESIEELELQPDPRFDAKPHAIIERSDVEDLAYGEFAGFLSKKLKSRVYIFGYDWRQSCVVNAARLAEYVEYLRAKLGDTDQRFNFVTHSMGGIVFGCYLTKLRGNFDTIERAVLTVPPFLGSIEALFALIVGEGGVNFPFFNSSDAFRKIARTFPSAYELCPTYAGAVVYSGNTRKKFKVWEPEQWQSNMLETDSKEIFTNRVEALEAFHDPTNPAMFQLDKLPEPIASRMLVIAGSGEETRQTVRIKAKDPSGRVKRFFDFEAGNKTKDGDGTVSLKSASCFSKKILTLNVESKWHDRATHAFFLKDGRVQTIINRFLRPQARTGNWWSVIGRQSVTRIR